MTLATTALYALTLVAAVLAGRLRETPERLRPRATLIAVAVIALFAFVQFFVPALLPALQRDTHRILAGEVWRPATALLVQDGGIAGSVFNLVSLLIVGAVAESVWGVGRWLAILLGGGLLGEAVALLWQPVGAGNSVAVFALAGGVAAAAFLRATPTPARIAGGVALITGVALVFGKDIHGAAVLWGALLALCLSPRRR